MTSYVEEQVQARIERARRKAELRKQQRAELNEARQHGLNARKTAKNRRRNITGHLR
ncbi:hypothetical protein MBT84_32900 [Streptomyces sp. MBT84]|uniref:hypothetical protein n=1 Tax=Streptomyces sp. MBT84 TaxID=1488414 RepID=UPI001C6E849B|nr:hypothetical protein [Streptomyces sp. MBT84]MBW8704409.1 hypothetical protein [Streptomyces sp. MBT84]